MNIGFAMCGSYCTFSKVFPVMEKLAGEHRVVPIFSDNVQSIESVNTSQNIIVPFLTLSFSSIVPHSK